MKTLKFAHDLVEQILNGTKTVTWRLFDDKNLSVGDLVEFRDSGNGEIFAQAEIVGVMEKTLGEVDEKDFKGHESYRNKEEMLETYKVYYGDKVDWETVVKIVEFKILRRGDML
jgi:hypothetical protein